MNEPNQMKIACPTCGEAFQPSKSLPKMLECPGCPTFADEMGKTLPLDEVLKRIPDAISEHDEEIDRRRRQIQRLITLEACL